ncbi:cellulase family glycosylhydrolase [Echinicola sp. CAU 1574]|uniref:Cellulase family glycosylhydrolase n=1 Tax=Echinicola arenosa TaxID=2774144 RepID=A0ABR9AJA3_9BACT|nr:cellulase family glycosylhydrolase [Echinicola arenosa]MBD8488873.1 cellulase family glycosylhydrolase [Echinicola arenosa]
MKKPHHSISHFLLALLLFGTLSACSDQADQKPVELTLSSSQLDYDADGGSKEIALTSNSPWEAQTTVNWLSLQPSSGDGNAMLTFTSTNNAETSPRSTTLEIKAGSITKSVSIYQAAYEPKFPDNYIPADASQMRDISSLELAQEMGLGWNLGNSLEAIGGETAWGNPLVTKSLIDAVKAAGFEAVRIPVAWSKFSDEANYTIDETWMNRVEEVVNYVLDNELYAIINIHWDGGWMQPTYAQQDQVNERLSAMWIQIALHFRNYDDHLLFAGSNEVLVEGEYGTPSPENYMVQNGFNQTFVDAVRSTGGRNTYRNLVVQGYNTNIDHTVNFLEIPEDNTTDRLMVEVHYYDPYEFALDENSMISQWGPNATDPSLTASWGNEAHADSQFLKMKTKFIDQGIPVILGEYGAITKMDFKDHEKYREDYIQYLTQSMVNHGLVPFYWDNGFTGNHGFGLFNRATGETIYEELVQNIMLAKK